MALNRSRRQQGNPNEQGRLREIFSFPPPGNTDRCGLFVVDRLTELKMDGLNAAEQRELAARMEKKQMKEFMTMYSRLVQRCFDDCVNDFTTKSLISREEGCVLRCVDKFLKGSQRLGERFQEQNAALMQSGQLPGR
ncbi:hypothetical protein VTN31DRAFT_5646 [Thermomyces dupontii]|uniref:uncharacterized protein n=1 Tax=Talaromyces thermophilus TaxID=28565 RepID=UPI00374348D7